MSGIAVMLVQMRKRKDSDKMASQWWRIGVRVDIYNQLIDIRDEMEAQLSATREKPVQLSLSQVIARLCQFYLNSRAGKTR
jgi:hypothetical protein